MTALREAHAELADELTGLIRDVVMLHSPDRHDRCNGCDWGGHDGPGMWPCRTINLIKEGMGC